MNDTELPIKILNDIDLVLNKYEEIILKINQEDRDELLGYLAQLQEDHNLLANFAEGYPVFTTWMPGLVCGLVANGMGTFLAMTNQMNDTIINIKSQVNKIRKDKEHGTSTHHS